MLYLISTFQFVVGEDVEIIIIIVFYYRNCLSSDLMSTLFCGLSTLEGMSIEISGKLFVGVKLSTLFHG